MADALSILLQIGVILLLGTLLSVLAKWIGIPEILFFILLGVGLKEFSDQVFPFLDIPFVFIGAVSLLTLALIVFEGSAHIRFHTLDRLSSATIRLVLILSVLHMVLFTSLAWLLFDVTVREAALFSALLAGTSAPVVLILLQSYRGTVIDILKFESIFNTPVNAILPFLVVDLFYQKMGGGSLFVEQLQGLALKVFVGIGVGVVAGVILFKVLRKVYSKVYSPLAVLIASLLTYVLAEASGGNGVLGVLSLGLLFGNLVIKGRLKVLELESVFARSSYILLFVLFGSLLDFSVDFGVLWRLAVLLILYYGIRFLSMLGSVPSMSAKEMFFMSLMGPNGVTAVAVIVVLAGMGISGMDVMFQWVGLFIIGQLLVSTVVLPFASSLLKKSRGVRNV